VDVRSPRGFDDAFAALIRERVDALTATESPLNVEHKDLIVSFATKNRLPTVFGERVFVEAGGLMSYGISFADLLRRLAVCMDKIFKGAKPADLPVEQPTKFELAVNLKTAKALGLTIPPSVLGRADQVIE
jgi:putative ABC transport system substrate-binding protein